MTGITDYLTDKMLDHTFRGDVTESAYIRPNLIYMSLHTQEPNKANQFGHEVYGGSYSRQIITFGASQEGIIFNSNTPMFTMPASEVRYFMIWDAPIEGNPLVVGALASPQTFVSNDTFQPQVGSVNITRITPGS